ncbi:hypothetical protein MATL_G00029030 [Megalops atlanticus]|uniref:Uncharacterized protein n=1 Tax=Megalops atlanticus TaxID=7932 RepID=A0A9D3TJW6_MEGAT|nr:hypothetical protein MATL_G00029030 [Megalops atlanticus]
MFSDSRQLGKHRVFQHNTPQRWLHNGVMVQRDTGHMGPSRQTEASLLQPDRRRETAPVEEKGNAQEKERTETNFDGQNIQRKLLFAEQKRCTLPDSVGQSVPRESNTARWNRAPEPRQRYSVTVREHFSDYACTSYQTEPHPSGRKYAPPPPMGFKEQGQSRESGFDGPKMSQAVIRDQIRRVVGDLEGVLGGLKQVHLEMKEVVQQIELLTSNIDLGEEEPSNSLPSDTLCSSSSSGVMVSSHKMIEDHTSRQADAGRTSLKMHPDSFDPPCAQSICCRCKPGSGTEPRRGPSSGSNKCATHSKPSSNPTRRPRPRVSQGRGWISSSPFQTSLSANQPESGGHTRAWKNCFQKQETSSVPLQWSGGQDGEGKRVLEGAALSHQAQTALHHGVRGRQRASGPWDGEMGLARWTEGQRAQGDRHLTLRWSHKHRETGVMLTGAGQV